jgi:predicted nucleic acid-binding Zn ribbon protein
MSSDRAKLKLDEQSFESLLAAAYTVQEHYLKQKLAAHQQPCPQCGKPLEPDHKFCGHCGARREEEFRPGERMQRKWASLWMMSQKSGAASELRPAQIDMAPDSAPSSTETPPASEEITEPLWADDTSLPGDETQAETNDLYVHSPLLRPSSEDLSEELFSVAKIEGAEAEGELNWKNLRLVLRFHRGDLYLAVAILVAILTVAWAIWAGPVTRSTTQRARLSLWHRTLVKTGIAEAPPAPTAVFRGDPTAKVWADPHTALYYCSGAEQFGKTADGHFSTQREAQLDRFSPAARTPCD